VKTGKKGYDTITAAVMSAEPTTARFAPKRRTAMGMKKTENTIPSGCMAEL
jgi:hypothetical protein